MINHLKIKISNEDYEYVKKEINKSNRQSVYIITLIGIPILCLLFLLSFFIPFLREATPSYTVGIIVALISLLLVVYSKEDNIFMTNAAMYLMIVGFLIFGLVVSFQNPTQQSVSFHIIMLIIACLFIEKPHRLLVLLVSATVLFCILACKFEPPNVRNADLINGISYSILSSVCGIILIRFKVNSHCIEKHNHVLSNVDILTNLQNRNSFEKRVEQYSSESVPILGCIYIDVNGLHEVNNTKGHKAGDEMLQTVANKISEIFGINDAYRIGGDEFVVFTNEDLPNIVENKIVQMNSELREKGYFISVGFESQEGDLELFQLIKNAELKMYLDKQHYYENNKYADRRCPR